MKNLFDSNFYEIGSTNDPSVPEHSVVPENGFRDEICTHEVDLNRLVVKAFKTDKLVLVPNDRVAGKNVDRELDFCTVFVQSGNRKYACNLSPDSQQGKYGDIPPDAMFVVIGEADAVYIILKNEDGTNTAYHIAEDDIVAIYFQTKQDRFGSRIYGCAVRDLELGFCHCWVTADPSAVKYLFRVFIETTRIDRDRGGEQ